MNFIAKHIQIIGLLMLTGFIATAAALYLNVPARATKPPVAKVVANYSCPMHPEVASKAPGDCPKCGMALLAATTKTEVKPAMCQHGDAAGQNVEAASAHAGCNHTEEAGAVGGCCSKNMQPVASPMPSGCTRNLYPPTTDHSEKPL